MDDLDHYVRIETRRESLGCVRIGRVPVVGELILLNSELFVEVVHVLHFADPPTVSGPDGEAASLDACVFVKNRNKHGRRAAADLADLNRLQ